jgi:hypothetical protein
VSPRNNLDGCKKSRPPSVFDPQTFQPVASRYKDYAIPVLKYNKNNKKKVAAAAVAVAVVVVVAAAAAAE